MNKVDPKPIGLAALDAMIAHAEVALERYRAETDERQSGIRWAAIRRNGQLLSTEDTLARLRAQRQWRHSPGGQKGAPRRAP